MRAARGGAGAHAALYRYEYRSLFQPKCTGILYWVSGLLVIILCGKRTFPCFLHASYIVLCTRAKFLYIQVGCKNRLSCPPRTDSAHSRAKCQSSEAPTRCAQLAARGAQHRLSTQLGALHKAVDLGGRWAPARALASAEPCNRSVDLG